MAAVDMAAGNSSNALMIVEITHLLIGDVIAKATVGGGCVNLTCGDGINVDGYTDFGEAGFGNLAPATYDPVAKGNFVQTALVRNVSTAVANNLSVNVDGCAICDSKPL